MEILEEKAWGKLNLTLDVLGKRADGYHDLKSVMQTVSLGDDIRLCMNTGEGWKLECAQEGVPCDERNLAWKAARVFCDAIGREPDGLTIRIEKRIPSGAGMGGGSADAAAVLRALNRYYGFPLEPMVLAELGGKIGSDVPFCVIGGTVMCEGRGEILRPLTAMPDCIFVLCKPEFSISTPVLYRKLDEAQITLHPDNDAMETAIAAGDIQGIAAQIGNVFESVVSAEYGQIQHIKDSYLSHGALAAQMTGSGSVVFGILPDMASAEAAARELKKTYAAVHIVQPV